MANKIRGKLKSIYRMAPIGGSQLPLSTLGNMTPQQHCLANKGEFSSPALNRDLCVTARGKIFADDPPNSIISGFQYYYNVVESIELTPETDAKLPTSNRTSIGVGEGITIYSNVPVLWEIQSDLITPASVQSTEYSNSIHITALDQAGLVTIQATNENTTQSITLTIITPVQMKFEVTQKIHTQNVLDSGFKADVYAFPDTVNFAAIQFAELESYATASGLLAEGNGQPHGKYINGLSDWIYTDEIVTEGKGTKLLIPDTVYGGQNEYPVPLPLDEGGQAVFDIEFIWKLKDERIHRIPNTVRQSTIITTGGHTTTQKDDQQVTFYYSDESINSHLTPGGQIPVPKPYPKN